MLVALGHGVPTRLLSQVPLAQTDGLVASLLHEQGKGPDLGHRKSIPRPPVAFATLALLIAPEREPGARGCTDARRDVGVVEADALGRKMIQVRRGDVLASVEADILPAEIVGDEDDDVGRGIGGSLRAGGATRERQYEPAAKEPLHGWISRD